MKLVMWQMDGGVVTYIHVGATSIKTASERSNHLGGPNVQSINSWTAKISG